MPLTIGSNISSLRVQNRLARNSSDLRSSFERLSSGLRINRASDDAAGLAISSLLGADGRVYAQGVRNLNDSLSFLNVAESALGQLSNIVIRQRELAEQAANGTLAGTQRASLNREAQALAAEYQRIIDTTGFNGQQLLDGSTTKISVQAGYGTDGNINADVLESTSQEVATGLGSYTTSVGSFGSGSGTVVGNARFLVGDMNLDGIDDIVALRDRNDTATDQYEVDVAVFLGTDGGTISTTPAVEKTLSLFHNGFYVGGSYVADLTDLGSDGDLDIRLSLTVDTGVINVSSEVALENLVDEGPLSFQEIGGFGATNQTASSAVGDFNNDGVEDTVTAAGIDAAFNIQDTSISTEYNPILLTQDSFNLLNQANARQAMDLLEENLNRISSAVARIGASQSRISTAASVLGTTRENFAAAESQIKDADIAFESSQLVRGRLLQQASAAILAQANQQPAIALSLLGTL